MLKKISANKKSLNCLIKNITNKEILKASLTHNNSCPGILSKGGYEVCSKSQKTCYKLLDMNYFSVIIQYVVFIYTCYHNIV